MQHISGGETDEGTFHGAALYHNSWAPQVAGNIRQDSRQSLNMGDKSPQVLQKAIIGTMKAMSTSAQEVLIGRPLWTVQQGPCSCQRGI